MICLQSGDIFLAVTQSNIGNSLRSEFKNLADSDGPGFDVPGSDKELFQIVGYGKFADTAFHGRSLC